MFIQGERYVCLTTMLPDISLPCPYNSLSRVLSISSLSLWSDWPYLTRARIFFITPHFTQYLVSSPPALSYHTGNLPRRPWLYWCTLISRVSYLTTDREICNHMNPTIYEYSRHHFLSRRDARIFYYCLTSYPTILTPLVYWVVSMVG